MSDLIGQSLGRYHILEQLGEGGMATVYKAFDTRLERDVAVKIIRTDQFAPAMLERILKRFEREAKALARLTHPNIVSVIDYGEHDGAPYLVMPYLPGGTLKQRLGKPMPWQEAVRILLPIAQALEYAHEHNIIHRDIKPSNILLTEKGQPMLSDFGIAKILESGETATLTGTGVGVGTPEYMAPEQWTGQAGPQSDLYSLGVVLYELVTGRKPYTADTPAAILLKQANEPLPRPGQFIRSLPEAVEKALLKALAKKPEDRYPEMSALAIALENLLSGQTHAPSAPAAPASRTVEETSATIFQEATRDDTETPRRFPESRQPKSRDNVTAESDEIVISLGGDVEMAFVHIPAGPFQMGSPEGEGDSDEHPQHEVYLDEYWMGKAPVTNQQYQAFVRATGRQAPNHWKKRNIPEGKQNHPVVYVTWQDAVDFCAWVSKVGGQNVRLPTEAEWEKAARGTDGRIYPWGNQKPNHELCNYYKFFSASTTPVGQFSPLGDSPFRCVDMAGNVWEWVADWYSETYYAGPPASNPTGLSSGQYRVLRGGSCYEGVNLVHSACRFRYDPAFRSFDFGFRCSRSI